MISTRIIDISTTKPTSAARANYPILAAWARRLGWKAKMTSNPTNYTEFWDFYVSEHSLPLTRLLHFAGTSLGILLLVFFVWSGRWYFFPMFFITGYAFAWFAHFVVEKNKPASFRFPLWSFISDFKMMFYMLTGRMGGEVARVFGDTVVADSQERN